MDISLIISLIIAFLVLSVVVSGFIQKREQMAAEKRQRAAQFVYRARNAQEILHNLRGIPTNPEITVFILEYITKNYKAAAALAPKTLNIQQEISRAMMHQQGFKPQKDTNIPLATDEHSLNVTLAKLRKLQAYLKSLNNSSTLNDQLFKPWDSELKSFTYQYEIDNLLKLAAKAVSALMPGTAKNHFETIKAKLASYPLEAPYQQQQLASLTQLEESLKQAISNKQSEDKAVDEKQQQTSDEEKPSLFGDKKKW